MSAEARNKSSKIIFGADGIRGIVGEWPFTWKGMRQIGVILGKFIQERSKEPPLVFVGRDTRPSGLEFVNQLKDSLSTYEIPVWDLGIASLPVIAYSVKRYSASLGILVSASHNPAEYSGMKLLNSKGLRCQLQPGEPFEDMIEKAKLTPCNISKRKSASSTTPFVQNYLHDHIKILGSTSLEGLKIVVDCSNGAVSLTAPVLLRSLGASVIARNVNRSSKREINENCGSEHVRKYPVRLIKLVRREKADYGIAFDGDGDRIAVVDRKGNFYNGDDFLYLLAIHHAAQNKLSGSTIVTTELSNSALRLALQKNGVNTLYTQNGDQNLENMMWSNGFRLGGEQVGNIILNDGIHGGADPLYGISLLLKLIWQEKNTLEGKSHSFRKLPQVLVSTRAATPVARERLEDILKLCKEQFEKKNAVRIISWNSSTEPGILNIMMEGAENQTFDHVSRLVLQFRDRISELAGREFSQLKILDLSTRQRLWER